MPEFHHTGEQEWLDGPDGRLARRLGDLNPLPAAPPAPAAVLGLVRQRRRRRRARQAGGSALVIALLAVLTARFAPAPAPGPGPEEATARWAHLTDPDLPSALRLRHAWLRTGDLPQPSGRSATPAAMRAPLRPIDALDAAALDPLG